MIAIVLVGLLACAGASPRWRHRQHRPPPSPFDDSFEKYINEDVFDTRRFWDELNRDLHREMMQLETMLTDFNRHFPSMASTEGIDGNEYKITIPLAGYEEKEIVVKSRRGLLMVQAVHKVNGQPEQNYMDIRTLPACVNEQGSWSFQNGELKIVFPLVKGDDGTTDVILPSVTPVPVQPDHSREEITTEVPIDGKNENVDIDEQRGDLGKNNELQTNEIPKVEATTYAVDLKDEVEFVPFKY